MSIRDFWNRTQVYFGIREEDWDDETYDDDTAVLALRRTT